ncbi:hypothetical protein M513_02793 [Trichuris suis]|uniref:Uncharacterized protein n=1 Tax=Trichuris suis TaxID=68888 RepID=A0A085MGJ2_9BILA|nr:hypothetical protein M513_02793 [Trichuris suis]
MSKEERSGRRGAVAGPPGPATCSFKPYKVIMNNKPVSNAVNARSDIVSRPTGESWRIFQEGPDIASSLVSQHHKTCQHTLLPIQKDAFVTRLNMDPNGRLQLFIMP